MNKISFNNALIITQINDNDENMLGMWQSYLIVFIVSIKILCKSNLCTENHHTCFFVCVCVFVCCSLGTVNYT